MGDRRRFTKSTSGKSNDRKFKFTADINTAARWPTVACDIPPVIFKFGSYIALGLFMRNTSNEKCLRHRINIGAIAPSLKSQFNVPQ